MPHGQRFHIPASRILVEGRLKAQVEGEYDCVDSGLREVAPANANRFGSVAARSIMGKGFDGFVALRLRQVD